MSESAREKDRKMVIAIRRPRCADHEAFEAWRQAARVAIPRGAGFCSDCTPAHQARMQHVGLCDHPEVTFQWHRDPDPLVEQGLQGLYPEQRAA